MSLAAILSASRTVAESPGAMRASLHFAGQTLIEYQARQAVQAGADRILILVGTITPQLSQAVDRLSAEGIAVALVRDMVSMVRDAPRDSDVLLVADGAVIAQAHFNALGGVEGDALLVADDSRASAPFERIDAGQRWAGLARITPALLFGTLDMIGDWDMALTLVRAAVQKGARRITVPQDDLLEGRVTIVESQQQADLVAQAVTAAGAGGAHGRGAAEYYLLAPLARMIGPSLMRMQVPALQVRIAAIALAAIALVPIELGWPTTGFLILVMALLLSECSDRLDELALRGAPGGWIAFCTPGIALLGIILAGGTPLAMDLALMLGIIGIADRWRRAARARPWTVFTPVTALLILIAAGVGGVLALGMRVAMLLAIASVATLLLSRNE
jgi:hypothetical protein